MDRKGRNMEMGQKIEETRCGTERQQQNGHGRSHIHVWWVDIGIDTLGVSDPSPRPDCTAQGYSSRKVNPHNFWL